MYTGIHTVGRILEETKVCHRKKIKHKLRKKTKKTKPMQCTGHWIRFILLFGGAKVGRFRSRGEGIVSAWAWMQATVGEKGWTQKVVGSCCGAVVGLFRRPSEETIRIENELRAYGYTVGETLGKGTYAKVKRGVHTSGRPVAIKIIDRRKSKQEHFVRKFVPREVELLSQLRHPNLVRVELVLDDKVCVCEVQELAEHGDLLSRIIKKNPSRYEERDAKLMFRQIVHAVDYIHSRDIVHRDLKSENLFLDRYDNIKIGDFGFIRIQHNEQTSSTWCGSKAYSPPEVLKGLPYSGKKVDIWSVGVVLYVILTGLMPYDETDKSHMIEKQVDHRLTFHSSVSQLVSNEAKQLIYTMLTPDVAERPSAHTLQSHSWLTDTPWKMRNAPLHYQKH